MEIESESMKLQFHIMIVPVVTKSGDKCGNALSDHGCNSSSGHTHFWSSEKSENQDWIKNDVSDCPCQLGSHTEDGSSG